MGEVEQEERQGSQKSNRGGRGQEQRPSVADLIKQMDTNKDGKLSKNEVKGLLAEGFSKVDENNDGFISREELEKGQKQNRQDGRQGNRN